MFKNLKNNVEKTQSSRKLKNVVITTSLREKRLNILLKTIKMDNSCKKTQVFLHLISLKI